MNANDHPFNHDLLAAYALGMLDVEEFRQVDELIARSPEARAELKSLREVVALLPHAAQPVEPPERVRQGLFARIEASQPNTTPVHTPRPAATAAAIPAASLPWYSSRRFASAALGLLAALVLALGGLTVSLQNSVASLSQTNQELTASLAQARQSLADTQAAQQAFASQLQTSQTTIADLTSRIEQSQRDVAALNEELNKDRRVFAFVTGPGVATRELAALNTSSPARGEMYMYPGNTEAVVLFRGLMPLQSGQVYQFWLANNDGKIPAGDPVTVGPDGLARLVLQAPREVNAYSQVMLTIENAGSAPQPTPQIVLEGSL
ncbi:MAG: anti-sigma factor [Chloroflexaceae bacterium]|jgi:anti-sigma-K factor RskA|nr:anti-sigma factor [Chloroflexaceae bacterium]